MPRGRDSRLASVEGHICPLGFVTAEAVGGDVGTSVCRRAPRWRYLYLLMMRSCWDFIEQGPPP